ncbi:protein SEEDLING PLASTID DEVELOPMENT 1 isoform X2 [Typha angustifolia]|uniref:protein SEEDLING PLASTID DEVELOPMENT 1 isoform X2 n=1 Tax=Typha angustifolia TaxID=59011 RepID=UPI003C309D81
MITFPLLPSAHVRWFTPTPWHRVESSFPMLQLHLSLFSHPQNPLPHRYPPLPSPPPFRFHVSPRFPSATTSLLPLISLGKRSSSPLICSAASSPSNDQPDAGFTDELRRLIVLLPGEMRRQVESHPDLLDLVEIVMDLGRRPLARFPSGDVFLSDRPISFDDLHRAVSQVGGFAADNRAGISGTLHRISAIRNRSGVIIGLTCRVGRVVAGSGNLLRDLVKDGESLLLIGPPGVGKTTIIREIARMLADDYKKRVLIVDTSNEIGGDGDIPHPGIGRSRRLQVPNPNMQHKVLIEAVENHMPQVIVIDEIGTELEATAASTIAQRGIQLVATAHGVTIENLIKNPSLDMLVGGIQSVILSDGEATWRGVRKTVLERKGPSVFTCGAEIISKTELRVHRRLEATVDALLAGRYPNFEVRKLYKEGAKHDLHHIQVNPWNDLPYEDGKTVIQDNAVRDDRRICDSAFDLEFSAKQTERSHEPETRTFALHTYGITETSMLQAIMHLGMDEMIRITDNLSEAGGLLALQSKLKKNPQIQAVAESYNIPIFVTKTSSLVQITKALRSLVNECMNGSKAFEGKEKICSSEKTDALEEARLAIEQIVIPRGECVQLLPRPLHLVHAQIELAKSFKLNWEIVGQEPSICLQILPLLVGIEYKTLVDQVADVNRGFQDLSISGCMGSQNGVARLPLLPE